MSIRIFVPRDSTAIGLGADDVAEAIAAEAAKREIDIQIVRNGTRGMLWLEPLIEVENAWARIGYGEIDVDDIPALFDAGFHLGSSTHPKSIGVVDEFPYLKKQTRLTFARTGITDPLSLTEYEALGGYAGLRKTLTMDNGAIVDTIVESGLRGRGGAAFPTGVKWKTVRNASAEQKYVVCNADEGDSGTFADRILMEGDPFALIEGMTIAAVAVGASKGYIYVRSEYPHAIEALNLAIGIAYERGYLGCNFLGSGKTFDLVVRKGAGSYICGEETALLESLEGKRGVVRAKPPLPALEGLFGKPTIVNNVISLASVPIILAKGAAYYKDFGMGRSRGTLPIQLAGNVRHGGLIETAFGVTLREVLYDFGGGSASGRTIKAVQVGGPLGSYLPESEWDTPLDYEAFAALWAVLGHGGIVVHDDTADMARLARYAMEFCAIESCGKCTPCRIGSTRGVEVIDKIIENEDRPQQITLLRDLCDVMLNGSLCAMGGMTPYPVLSALKHFPQDFGQSPSDKQST